MTKPMAATGPGKALITGAAGFIGSHLADLLLAEGYEVAGIDNFATGRPENVQHLAGNPKFSLTVADICDQAAIAPCFAGADVVFHLAALADIVPSIVAPQAYFHANVDGTFAVLEAARAAGIKRFLYVASSSCYGIPDVYPTPETAAIRPQYPYALTKWLGEQMAMHWCQIYKLPVVSLRLFNVFGPRARTSGTYGAVFGVFLAQKLAGKPLTIVGDGAQTRDFTYVTDVARAMLLAVRSDLSGQIMNVGSGGHYSVNALAEMIGGECVNIPKRPGEPDCTFADIGKITELLSWRPLVPFTQGVELVLQNIESWRKAPVWTPDSIAEATRDWFKYLS